MVQNGNNLDDGSGGAGGEGAALRRFPARLAALPDALVHVADGLRAAGAAPAAVARAELIVEELFRNSVLHGYRGDAAQSVWLGVWSGEGAGFVYEDAAAPFDPLRDGPPSAAPDPALSIAEQPVGGVGLLLIRQLGQAIDYAYRDGRNCLKVSLANNV